MSETTTETGVVWFEVPARDSARAREFYGGLFGWEFERFGDLDYHTTSAGRGAIAGGADEQGLLTYFGVADIDGASARVRDHAQTIARSPTHSTCDCGSANGDQRDTAMSMKPRRFRAGTAAPSSTV